MRTHLLRTVYPSAAAIEPDTGSAANDTCYLDPSDSAKVTLSLIATPAQDEQDDYVLGGYAGI